MPDIKQLPYLLALIDDESPITRRAVLKELSAFGKNLENYYDTLTPITLSAAKTKPMSVGDAGQPSVTTPIMTGIANAMTAVSGATSAICPSAIA